VSAVRASGSLLAALLAATALLACASKPHVDVPQSQAQPVNRTAQLTEAATYNVELGMAYMERGDLGLAKEKLERALKENPRSAEVHSALALLDERLGNAAGADDEFHAALRLAPHSPDIANNYAVYLCHEKHTDEGVKRLMAVAGDPLYRTPEAAYTNAAVCLRGAHRDDEAERDLQRALLLRPSFGEAVFQLAELQLQRGELSPARTRIDNYIGTYTATPDLLLLGVRIARAQGDRPGEQRYAQRLRVDFPDSPQTRALMQGSPNPG
jgi:type IV pilus assembly protein PilF